MQIEEVVRRRTLFEFVLDEERIQAKLSKLKKSKSYNHVIRVGFAPKGRFVYLLVKDPLQGTILEFAKFQVIGHATTEKDENITWLERKTDLSWEGPIVQYARETGGRDISSAYDKLFPQQFEIPSSTLCRATKRYDLRKNAQFMPDLISFLDTEFW